MNRNILVFILVALIIIMLLLTYLIIRDPNRYVKIDTFRYVPNDKVQINVNYGNNYTDDADDSILLSLKEIEKYNEIIKSKTDELYDLNNIKKLSKEEIEKYILKYDLPSGTYYDNKKVITSSEKKQILNNRNLDNIKDLDNIQKGIIVKRANLRSFPTNTNFYDAKNSPFDRLQETELLVNTGVLILHTSSDQKWNFVISPIYMGWVECANIGLANDDDYNYFINNDSFGIIISSSYIVGNVTLDMSVKLPYYNGKFILPMKNSDGYVGKTEVVIPSDQINIGYLPYTKVNVINEAYKYEGVSYSWGGYDKNVDCSSFIANIYRTFGFIFPRNTSSQNKSVGKDISLSGMTDEEKLKLIDKKDPSLLYMDGHVMLYIGTKNDKHYIIHASGSGKVMVSVLEDSTYIKQIDKLVLVGQ